jgi:AAA+ superfamily predicted ATPase
MKPKLIVVKKRKLKDARIVTETHFAIIDLDNPQWYQSNFVCILLFREQAFKKESAYKVEFNKIFGKESLVRALKFLKHPLLEESDSIIPKCY